MGNKKNINSQNVKTKASRKRLFKYVLSCPQTSGHTK